MSLWAPCVELPFVETLRAYVQDHIAPKADAIDRDDIYPTEILKGLAQAGYNTVTLPIEYGGTGQSYRHAAAVFEEVSYASAAVGISLITIFQAQSIIRMFGSEALKATYLPRFAGGLISSYALTEASHGSDIRSLDTKATKANGGWVIRGEKSFITSGSGAEFFIILAETDRGISAFAVPRETPGLSTYVGTNSATFGLRNGPHVNLVLNGIWLPEEAIIGLDGKGIRQAVGTLNYSRTLAGAISIGIARAAFDNAIAYAAGRRAFDQRVIEFQGIQWYFADMLSEIDAARLLVYRAAQALDDGDDIERWGSAAKLKAAAVATEVASRAIQICGAHGTMETAPFGRFLRDAKAYEIAGGSSEILRNTIGKYLVRSYLA
jgi:acyl-CoA dehydrogenase